MRIPDHFPGSAAPERVAELLRHVRIAAEEAGRDFDAIEITCGLVTSYERAARLADLGVHRLTTMSPRGDPETVRAQLEAYRKRVIEPFGA